MVIVEVANEVRLEVKLLRGFHQHSLRFLVQSTISFEGRINIKSQSNTSNLSNFSSFFQVAVEVRDVVVTAELAVPALVSEVVAVTVTQAVTVVTVVTVAVSVVVVVLPVPITSDPAPSRSSGITLKI